MRYLAQDIITGEMLHTDVPIAKEQLTYTLSGPNRIEGVIEPELAKFRRPNGSLLMEPYGVWLHAEEDGIIRQSNILVPKAYQGEQAGIAAEGVSSYPHGMLYVGNFAGVDLDIYYAAANIWAHLQSFQNAVQLGVILEAYGLSGVLVGNETKVETVQQANGTTKDVLVKIPYTMSWVDNKDCGQEFDDLAKKAPFDYTERSYWNAAKTSVNHRITLGYPRLGRRRFDLRFVEGENMRLPVMPQEPAGRFASVVYGLGAGSDQAQLRSYSARPNPKRLRRMYVYSNPSITSQARLDFITTDEINRRSAVLEVQTVEIMDKHPNAPIGSFIPGDEILIQATVPWYGDVVEWHRIISFTHVPWAGAIQLKLRRADSFRYGGV